MRLRYIFCKDIKGYSKQRYMLGLFMYKRRENEFMKKRMIRFCCGVMAAGLLLSGIPVPAMSGNMQKGSSVGAGRRCGDRDRLR